MPVSDEDFAKLQAQLNALKMAWNNHLGVDYGAATQDSPHPSQNITTANFGTGTDANTNYVGRLDPSGISLLNGQSQIHFVPSVDVDTPLLTYPQTIIYGLSGSGHFGFSSASNNGGGVFIDTTGITATFTNANGTTSVQLVGKPLGDTAYLQLTAAYVKLADTGAPLSPANGDFWYASGSGLFFQYSGVSYNLTGAVYATIIDAKGDLLVGTAADTVARLPVGTDGQTLIADSTQTAGVKWGDASSAWVQIPV